MSQLFPAPYDKVNEDYQNIVYGLLSYFESIGCTACIAGGCIRDWRINNNINDIDFFISLKGDYHTNYTWTKRQFFVKINEILNNAPHPGWSKVDGKSKSEPKKSDAINPLQLALEKIEEDSPVYDKELFVFENTVRTYGLKSIEPIKIQLIFVPLTKYTSIFSFICDTFDFDINKGVAKLEDGKIRFDDSFLVAELERATITFNLSKLIEDTWRLKKVPDRAARFQDKLSNFNIRIV